MPWNTRLIILIIRIQMSQTDEKSLNLKLLRQFMASITRNEGYIRHIDAASSIFGIKLETCPNSIYQSALRIKQRQERLEDKLQKAGEISSSDGVSCWAMGQQKLFYWVALSYCYCHSIIPHTMKIQEVVPIQAIFANKMSNKLLFELKILTCNKSKQENWSQQEDDWLRQIVKEEVTSVDMDNNIKWKLIAYEIFRRSGYEYFKSPRQARQRWINHINPVLLKNEWTFEEDHQLFQLVAKLGTRWALISKKMGTQRTEHMVKNRVNSILKKIYRRRPKILKNNHIEAIFAFLQERKAKSQPVSSPQMNNAESIRANSYSPTGSSDNEMFSEYEERIDVQSKQQGACVMKDGQIYCSRLQWTEKNERNYEENNIFDILTLPKTAYLSKLVANFESQEDWLNRYKSEEVESWFQQ